MLRFKSFLTRLISALLIFNYFVFGYSDNHLSLGLVGLNMGLNMGLNTQAQAYQSNYQKTKNQIDSLNQQAKEAYQEVEIDYETSKNLGQTLDEEIARLEKEIKSIKLMLKSTELTVSEMDELMKVNQTKIENANKKIAQVIKEVHKLNLQPPIHTILSSKNIGEAVSNLRNLNSIQKSIKQLKKDIEFENQEWQKNKQEQAKTRVSLDETKALLESKQESIKAIIEQTEGQDENYQKILKDLRKAEQQLDNKIQVVQKDIRKKEKYKVKDSPTKCYFEVYDDLGVPNNFFARPAKGWLTQRFHCAHSGIDIANRTGTPVVAVANGTVVKNDYNYGGFGNFVMLRHDLPSGTRVYSLYAHLHRKPNYSVGKSFAKGEKIGDMGSTGYSTGPHVHFMLISSSYDKTKDHFCQYGYSKCYNPARFLNF